MCHKDDTIHTCYLIIKNTIVQFFIDTLSHVYISFLPLNSIGHFLTPKHLGRLFEWNWQHVTHSVFNIHFGLCTNTNLIISWAVIWMCERCLCSSRKCLVQKPSRWQLIQNLVYLQGYLSFIFCFLFTTNLIYDGGGILW